MRDDVRMKRLGSRFSYILLAVGWLTGQLTAGQDLLERLVAPTSAGSPCLGPPAQVQHSDPPIHWRGGSAGVPRTHGWRNMEEHLA